MSRFIADEVRVPRERAINPHGRANVCSGCGEILATPSDGIDTRHTVLDCLRVFNRRTATVPTFEILNGFCTGCGEYIPLGFDDSRRHTIVKCLAYINARLDRA